MTTESQKDRKNVKLEEGNNKSPVDQSPAERELKIDLKKKF